MDEPKVNPEKDVGMLGGLFQTVVNDLRGSSPIWEDFTYKSVKLHSSLKTTVVAIGAFLEAFQKVADMATNSKGATREIGSALTRLCMRHRSIESHLKLLTSSILDNLVTPLQEKLEDWKKAVAQLDKDHSKEYKKAKLDIKKAASDTIRLQKKVKKGATHGKSDMHQKLESAMLEVNSKYHELEETEKNSVRLALIEERSRFCLFITCLKPFVDQELKLLTEISHISEIMESLCMQASEPSVLPPSSEQVILDLKGVENAWSFNQQPSPPSSPSSLGSRKSSMCSINSINSSSSGSSHSPSHTMHKRNTSQPPAIRLTSVSSQDSGFTSQDTLFLRPTTPQSLSLYQPSPHEDAEGDCDSTPTTPSDNTPSACSTWNNWPNLPSGPKSEPMRPHTISTAYEKGHARPALSAAIFEPPQEGVEMRRSSSQNHSRPSATISKLQPVLPPHCPKPKGVAVAPPMLPPGAQPIYANMSDISPDDGEPTTPTTPAVSNKNQGASKNGMFSLDEAMEQMELCSAGLKVELTGHEITLKSSHDQSHQDLIEVLRPKIQQNTSLELAKAIRELEASTAALTSAYDSETMVSESKTSLPSSSGYGTMNSTPASSQDPLTSGGAQANIEELYEELDGLSSHKPGNKPPPPVRRTMSVSGAPTHLIPSPSKQLSLDSPDESPYAELQYIQQSIQKNVKQESCHIDNANSKVPPPPIHPPSLDSGACYSQTGSGGAYKSPPAVHQKPNKMLWHPTDVTQQGSHRQHVDHGSHRQHVDHGSHRQHVDHGSHRQHVDHGSHRQHVDHGSHRQHVDHGSHRQHVDHGSHRQHFAESNFYSDKSSLQLTSSEDDLPLPPTVEELQEMERIYSRPQTAVSYPKVEDPQASLLLELKHRVSIDDGTS
ncbi:uncharacterized protein LOC131941431 isoform X2 [Physella acuta]|uniref:uncharacterized protein LOC131941431 isoform X2 n=1 Tax=Physella acuta TaxID=109671 RepID=UPI0027DC4CD3|nr:uncharacterized protein LOC131941431 isoform X2 [Physella acuta]